jgi:hypothetical protein
MRETAAVYLGCIELREGTLCVNVSCGRVEGAIDVLDKEVTPNSISHCRVSFRWL